jgi:hypothetical protein
VVRLDHGLIESLNDYSHTCCEDFLMILYTAGAFLVFSLSLRSFFRDSSTAKTDPSSWLVLAIATVFWPFVLPSILRKKLSKASPEFKSQVS